MNLRLKFSLSLRQQLNRFYTNRFKSDVAALVVVVVVVIVVGGSVVVVVFAALDGVAPVVDMIVLSVGLQVSSQQVLTKKNWPRKTMLFNILTLALLLLGYSR